MLKSKLTKRQQAVLDFISDYIDENHFPPAMKEICDHFGIKSLNGVSDHLKVLERKGHIRRSGGKSRSIEIIGRHDQKEGQLPILGQIAAGSPILAEENFDGYLDVQNLFGRTDGNFVLRVKGESMIEVGIFDGDYIIVRNQHHLTNGEIGVFVLDNEATVKRFFDEERHFRLQPENSAMGPIIVDKRDAGHSFNIGGKVVGVIRRFRE